MSATTSAIELAKLAASAAADKVAENPVALDVSAQMPLTDIFLIVSGRNERQVMAISDGVEEKLLESGVKLLRREGKAGGRWVLLDFGEIIVHVFHEQERVFYSLERIWGDCPVISLPEQPTLS
ncbi:MAG: ribosome silencing factor [Actinomycetota bacterium]